MRIVGAKDAAAYRSDVSADRAINMSNIGWRIDTSVQHSSLHGNDRGEYGSNRDNGGGRTTHQLMQNHGDTLHVRELRQSDFAVRRSTLPLHKGSTKLL